MMAVFRAEAESGNNGLSPWCPQACSHRSRKLTASVTGRAHDPGAFPPPGGGYKTRARRWVLYAEGDRFKQKGPSLLPNSPCSEYQS